MTVCFVFSTVTPKPTSDLVVFKRIIHQLAVDSVAEDGCIFYQILQTAEEPNIYYVLSKFRDMEALELHEQAPSRMTAMNNFLELARSDMNQKLPKMHRHKMYLPCPMIHLFIVLVVYVWWSLSLSSTNLNSSC